jgi:anti-anti-sigma factor
MDGIAELRNDIKGDVLVLRFSGRLDAMTTPDLEKQVSQFIDHGQHKLLLDFTGVDYISSAGMRMLLATTKKLKSLSGQMVLCCTTDNVMDVFKMSGFDHVLLISPSEDEALSRF